MASLAVTACSSPSSQQATSPVQCATRSQAFLNLEDLGDFEMIVDNTFLQPPVHHRSGSVRPEISDFRIGRQRGYISSRAVTGPYRAELDQRAKSLGYPIQQWPIVPLVGSVVRDTPGVLEFYQTDLVFKSTEGITQYLESGRRSASVDPRAHDLAATSLAPEGFEYLTSLGPDDGSHEHAVHIVLATELVAIEVSVQGGSDLGQGGVAEALAAKALTRYRASCRRNIQ